MHRKNINGEDLKTEWDEVDKEIEETPPSTLG